MKILVISIIILILIFTFVTAYAEISSDGFRMSEIKSPVHIQFDLIEFPKEEQQPLRIFPIRFVVKTEEDSVFLSMNGLAFLTYAGLNYGKQVVVTGTQKGDVISMGGQVIVAGRVEGDVWAFNANIILRSNTVVTGNVVALGGSVFADSSVFVNGTKQAIPDIHIPLLGLLVSLNPIKSFPVHFSIFSAIIFLLFLFVYISVGRTNLDALVNGVTYYWKRSLLIVFIAFILLPILVLLLVVASVGIILIPLLFLILIVGAYMGFSAISVRVGNIFFKNKSGFAGVYLSGVVGYLLINGLTILAFILSLLGLKFLEPVSDLFYILGAIVVYIALIFGFGIFISHYQEKTKQA
jgi:hypothetical protein